MSQKYSPKNITVETEEKRVIIEWGDGHVSAYPYGGLRKSCPCVYCQGGHEYMGKPMDPISFLTDSPDNLKIKNLKPAGNYALHFFWSDGHSTGIYRYEYLRDGCPVEAGILPPPYGKN